MRKLILFVVIAFMLNVCPVNAETSVIHTEAENYTSKNNNLIQTMKRTGLSNGSAMVVYNSSGNRNYELNYNVNCESAGIYNFSAGISPIGNVYYPETILLKVPALLPNTSMDFVFPFSQIQ